jgi:predicted nucleic acid-binding protein
MILLDTNILLRLADLQSVEYPLVERTLKQVIQVGEIPVIGLQVMVEFWVVATRPVTNNGLGWKADKAEAVLRLMKSRFPCIDDRADTAIQWFGLVTQHQIIGKRAHDIRLIALMKSHGIQRLLTLNPADFRGLGIDVVEPH